MATITANVGSFAYNTNAAWVGSVQPTAADDVTLPASAVITIPPATTALGRSVTVQASSTLAFAATSSTLTIGDATAGAGNVALSISATATLTITGADAVINFVSTSATQQTITTNGKTIPSFFQTGSGSYLLVGALTTPLAATSQMSVTAGTFNTNNVAITGNIFSSTGVGARTLTFGSSAISLARSGTALQLGLSGLTVTANTAIFTTSSTATVNMGGVNMNGASLVFSGAGTKNLVSGGTWNNITVTGTAVKTDILTISTANVTCTGTFTANGNSTINRQLIQSETPGTARTITAASVSCSNLDLMDITGAGVGSWNLSAITGGSGDAGGNSGITFTPGLPTTYDATAGSWSTAARFSGGRVPLPQDDVSFSTSSVAVALDMPRVGKNVNFANYSGTLTWTTNLAQTFYGSITLSSGMTNTFGNTVNYVLAGRGTHTFDSAGKLFNASNISQTTTSPGGTYSLASAYSSNGSATLLAGTFTTNNFSLTVTSFGTSGAIVRTLNLGSSTVSLTIASNTNWSWAGTNATLNAGTSNIVVSTAGTAVRTFAGGGVTYNNLTYSVADSATALPISGANTFNTIALSQGKAVTFVSGTQNSVAAITGTGSSFGYQRFGGGGIGSYVSIPDSAALSITGDFDFCIRLRADSWATANMGIAGKRTTVATGFSWHMSMNSTSRQLTLSLSSTGTTLTTVASTVGVGISDGADGWIRATWRASDGRVQFFTSTDSTNSPASVTWTQLGTDRTAAVVSIFDSPAPITLSVLDTVAGTTSFSGRMYRFQIRNNILNDGTGIQADVNFVTKTFGANTFTESSSNAATVSIVGDSAQAGDGRILIRSATASSPTHLHMYSTPQTLDGYQFQDIMPVIPRKIFAPNSFNISGNQNIVFGAFVSEPYVAFTGATTGSGASTVVTLPFTPTVGDLLVVGFGNSTDGTGTITPPTGFVLDKGTSATTAMRIYSKISNGTETSLTWTTSLAPAVTTLRMLVIRGFTGTPTLDVTDTNTNAAATALSTGAGATNTSTPAIMISMIQGASTLGASISATNSFEWIRPTTETTTARTIMKPLSAIASNLSTFTWTTSRAVDFETVIYRFDSTYIPRYGFVNFQGPGLF